MSLILNFNICENCNCKELTFFDTTGEYNSTTNTTGYNSPNPDTTTATAVSLVITRGDGEVFTIDLKTLSVDQFPTILTDWGFVIPNSYFGYTDGAKIPDQIMTFKYSVTFTVDDVDTTYSTTKYKAFYCQSKCCLANILESIDWECDDCVKSKIDKYTTALVLYNGMIASANTGNITAFNKQLVQLTKLCTNSNCSNCAQ